MLLIESYNFKYLHKGQMCISLLYDQNYYPAIYIRGNCVVFVADRRSDTTSIS